VKFLIAICLLFTALYSGLSSAAELQVTPGKTEFSINETLLLTVVLSDSRSSNKPDFSVLQDDFNILQTNYSSAMTFVNGTFESRITWRLLLKALTPGEIIIPPISVRTPDGIIESSELVVNVSDSENHVSSDAYETPIIGKERVYENEAVVYTIRRKLQDNVSQVRIEDFTVSNAIVEAYGSPVVQVTEYGKVLEASWSITPLKAGTIKIPKVRMYETLISSLGFFAGGEYESVVYVKPVGIESIERKDDVDPWFPASSFDISVTPNQSMSDILLGKPFIITLEMEAEGIIATQLPDISGSLRDNEFFRVYTDPPKISTKILEGKVLSRRVDTITLIPQKTGNAARIPEITVYWWDTVKDIAKNKTILGDYVRILPGESGNEKSTIPPPFKIKEEYNTDYAIDNITSNEDEFKILTPQNNSFIKILLVLLSISIAVIIYLFIKIRSMRKDTLADIARKVGSNSAEKADEFVHYEKKSLREFIKDLEKINTTQGLSDELRLYLCTLWGYANNTPLRRIAYDMCEISVSYGGALKDIAYDLESVIYHGKQIPFSSLKERVIDLVKDIMEGKSVVDGNKDTHEHYSTLNP